MYCCWWELLLIVGWKSDCCTNTRVRIWAEKISFLNKNWSVWTLNMYTYSTSRLAHVKQIMYEKHFHTNININIFPQTVPLHLPVVLLSVWLIRTSSKSWKQLKVKFVITSPLDFRTLWRRYQLTGDSSGSSFKSQSCLLQQKTGFFLQELNKPMNSNNLHHLTALAASCRESITLLSVLIVQE